VSLPAGCFNPYSGVKTSILLLDKSLSKRTDEILFVKVENDGFDLGAQRRPIEKNDLPDALKAILDFRLRISDLKKELSDNQKSIPALTVKKARLLENGGINLSGDRYRETGIRVSTKWPMILINNICTEIRNGVNVEQKDDSGKYRVSRIQTISDWVFDLKKTKWTDDEPKESDFLQEGDVLLSHINSIEHLAKSAIFTGITEKVVHGVNLIKFRPNKNLVNPYFLYLLMSSSDFVEKARGFAQKAVNQASIKLSDLKAIQIPLPPLEVQEKIVAELDGYRKIIEGAKQIIANYKPTIKIDPKWPTVYVGDVLKSVKYTQKVQKTQFLPSGKFPIVDQSEQFIAGYWNDEIAVFKISKPVVLFGDHTRALKYVDFDFVLGADGIKILQPDDCFIPMFFYFVLLNSEIPNLGYSRHFKELVRVQIPLPPLDVQRRIVEEIEAERELVEANRKLINIYEQKIQTKLAEIWGSEEG
jgi:type I restriction enzyme M protein